MMAHKMVRCQASRVRLLLIPTASAYRIGPECASASIQAAVSRFELASVPSVLYTVGNATPWSEMHGGLVNRRQEAG
jgi:hypothetical protein